jgi:fused signal recognition particle receptor
MKSLFSSFKRGLQRTKTLLVRNIQSLFSGTREWTQATYDELEAILIGADLGVGVSQRLLADIRDRYQRGEIGTAEDILRIARTDLANILATAVQPIRYAPSGPTIVLLVGVNGSGKTTTAAKLAHMWKEDGKSVGLAACDTFRAAAIEQLKIWGERVGCPVIAAQHGADAASVAFDAAQAALARKLDVMIIDTAGRQHTRKGLMEELGKIRRVLDKACPGAPHEVWLVVDGSTGTNALHQAREFTRVADLSGLCLTKLDGTSKGGIVVAIHDELKLPVRFVGLGEAMGDLQPFDPHHFADALFQQ